MKYSIVAIAIVGASALNTQILRRAADPKMDLNDPQVHEGGGRVGLCR